MVNKHDYERWEMAVCMLTLDAASPYFRHMGVPLRPDSESITGMRPLIRRLRPWELGGHGLAPFVEEFDNLLSKFHGSHFDSLFVEWLDKVFAYSSPYQKALFDWKRIIARGGLDGSRDANAPPKLIRLVRIYWQVAGEIDAARMQVISDWDCELNAYYVDPEDEESKGLLPWIEYTIDEFSFLFCWNKAARDCDHAALDSAFEWARHESALLGIPVADVLRPESCLMFSEAYFAKSAELG